MNRVLAAVMLALGLVCGGCGGSRSEPPAHGGSAPTPAGSFASSTPSSPDAATRSTLRARAREAAARHAERVAEGLVREYYDSIDARDFSRAWAVLGRDKQASFGGYDTWRKGFDTTVSLSAHSLSAHALGPGLVEVHVALASVDADACADNVKQSFAGAWRMTRDESGWHPTSIAMNKTGGGAVRTRVEDCPGVAIPSDAIPPPTTSPSEAAPPYPDYANPAPNYTYPAPDYTDPPPTPYPTYSPPTTQNFNNGTGAIGTCADGTVSHSIGHQGACSHHHGVGG